MKYFFSILINISFFIILITSTNTSVKVEKCSSDCESNVVEDFPKDPYKVKYYRYSLKSFYYCNNYSFFNEIDALNYYHYLYSNTTDDKQKYKPNGGTKKWTVYKLENRYLFREYSGKMYYFKNSFTAKINPKVWKNCSYKCYSENNFTEFKKKMVEELNMYRELHDANQLVYNETLAQEAQKIAEEKAQKGSHSHCDKNLPFGCLFGSLIHFNVGKMLYSMYNEFLSKYDFAADYVYRRYTPGLELIWKNVKQVGVGVAEDSLFGYVIFTFSSKITNDSSYYDNIFPVQNKYIQMYAKD
ncbi:CAP domain-containing protein [Strongyloides ratti]|uniref:CAP domain-containing protein n=1 Tax=Strongyloides ratti TaxID=34506 RepID=A0A090L606_STRRB|nr:CAP domain-containing protein [Strongyloides ratti]CEF63562.1 CAP domain-containing protein [Strongyloides ratti]